MRTRLFMALLLSIGAMVGVAQTRTVQFSYDHAGNRTSRLIVLPAAAQAGVRLMIASRRRCILMFLQSINYMYILILLMAN